MISFFIGLCTLGCAILVVTVSHMVHALVFLILTFIGSSILILQLQMGYLGLALITIYVGSIAVLFLFVVMMLQDHEKIPNSSGGLLHTLPLGLLIGFPIVHVVTSDTSSSSSSTVGGLTLSSYLPSGALDTLVHNQSGKGSSMVVLGQILYTDYGILVLLASLVLLVAMIGAIVLVQAFQSGTQKQDVKFTSSQDQCARYW